MKNLSSLVLLLVASLTSVQAMACQNFSGTFQLTAEKGPFSDYVPSKNDNIVITQSGCQEIDLVINQPNTSTPVTNAPFVIDGKLHSNWPGIGLPQPGDEDFQPGEAAVTISSQIRESGLVATVGKTDAPGKNLGTISLTLDDSGKNLTYTWNFEGTIFTFIAAKK